MFVVIEKTKTKCLIIRMQMQTISKRGREITVSER